MEYLNVYDNNKNLLDKKVIMQKKLALLVNQENILLLEAMSHMVNHHTQLS